jgi:hypothetical protein
MKRALYRDRVARFSVRYLRSHFAPRIFKGLEFIAVEGIGDPVRVRLIRIPESSCFSGERVFLACPHPSCGNARANVIGYDGQRWGCTRCLRWRGRNRVSRPGELLGGGGVGSLFTA